MKTQTNNLGKVALTIGGVHKKAKAYDKLTIVLNKFNGISYVSRKPVPVNVDIDNVNYWMPFGIAGKALILAMTSGNSEIKTMTQKAITDLYNALSDSVDQRFAAQAETNQALLNISEEAQHYANLSQEASATYLAALEQLQQSNPQLASALLLAVTVGNHTNQITAIEQALGGTSFIYITETQYQTLASTGEVEITPAVYDQDGVTITTPAVVLEFDEDATYMTYEETTTSSDSEQTPTT